MTYVVTARKWRPQLFADVIGQSHVTETLKNAIRTEQVGHAYLFSGPRGVGKTTVARIFAKALNCEHGPAEEPCNTCPVCKAIQSGSSLDIQEIDGASHNSVEDVRELQANIGYHSNECRFKMYIVDEVHMLSKPAFNALLKTLEEPPPNVIFVFATTEPQKIPPTILSRCQRYDFRRLSVNDIAGKLKKIAEADGIDIDEASIILIARRATGAMRDAESILEQLKASRGKSITVQDVKEVLGIAGREVFFDIIDRCSEQDSSGAIGLFTDFYDEGGDLKEFIEGLLEHLRDMMYAVFGGGLDHVILPDDLKDRLRAQAAKYGQHDVIRMIGYVMDVESSLNYAVLPVLSIEVALARMATMESTLQIKDLLKRLGGAPSKKAKPAASGQQTAPSGAEYDPGPPPDDGYVDMPGLGVPAAPPVADEQPEEESLGIVPDIGSISDNWHTVTDNVSSVKPAIGPSLAIAAPEQFKNGQLTVSFAPEEEFHRKAVDSNAKTLAEIIGGIIGTQIVLKTTSREAGAKKKTNNELDDLISREPVIGDIIDLFDGEFNGTWRE